MEGLIDIEKLGMAVGDDALSDTPDLLEVQSSLGEGLLPDSAVDLDSEGFAMPSEESTASEKPSTMASIWNNVKELNREITDEEIKNIAGRYNASDKQVRQMVRLYRGDVSSKGMADTLLGTMDKIAGWTFAIAADLPQKALQTMEGAIEGKFFSEEDKQKRLELWDTVRELTRERRTVAGDVVEFGVGMIPFTRALRVGTAGAGMLSKHTSKLADAIAKTPFITAKPLAAAVRMTPQAALGAGIGAGAGLAQSRSGEELEGIKSGAMFGAILTYGIPMGVMGVAKLGSYIAKPLNFMRRKQIVDITGEVERDLVAHATRERAFYEAGYRKNTKLEGFTNEEIIEVAKQVGAFKNKNIVRTVMAANPGMNKAEVVKAIQKAGKSTPEYQRARDELQVMREIIMATPAYHKARVMAKELRDEVRNTKGYVEAKKAADDARRATGVDSPEYKAAYSKFKEIRQEIMTSPKYKNADKAARKLTNAQLRTPEYKQLQKKMGEAQLGGKMGFEAYRDAVAEEVSQVAKKEFVEFGDVFLPAYTQLEKKPEDFIDALEALTEARAIQIWTRNLNVVKPVQEEIEALLQKGATIEARDKLVKDVKLRELSLMKMHPTLDALEKFVSDVEHTEGSVEAMQSLWNKFRFGKLASKVMVDPLKTKKAGIFSKFFYTQSASQHVLHDFDRRAGSDLGFHGMRLNTKQQLAENIYFRESPETAQALDKAQRAFFGDHPDDSVLKSLVKYIENPKQWKEKNGNIPEGFEEYRKLHTDVMEKFRQLAGQYGVKIDRVTSVGYVHRAVKSSRDIGNILRAEVRELNESGVDLLETRLTPRQFRALLTSNPKAKEVVDSIKYISGGAKIDSTEDLVNYWARMNNHELTDEMIARVNSFGYHRSQEQTIPWLIREINPAVLADKWLKESLSFAITREPLREISKWISIFSKRGMTSEADYLKTYIRKATGVERSWLGRTGEAIDEFVDTHIPSPFVRESLKAIPAVSSSIMNLMYGTLLAGPKSFFQNLEQPITKMAHGIGETIGMDITLRAYARTAAIYAEIPENLLRKLAGKGGGELDLVLKMARDKGFIPAKQYGEAINNSKLDRTRYLVNGVARVFTYMFEKSDQVTRVVALFAAGDLSEQIIKRSPKVLSEFVEGNLKRFPSIQKQVKKLADAGKADELTDLLSEHLLQTEMFIYNNTSKAQFMHKLGPYITMFSKWPTEIIGDVMGGIRAGEAERTFIRAVTPLLQMSSIAMFLGDKYKGMNRDAKKAFEVYPGKPEVERYAGRTPITSPAYLYNLFLKGDALKAPIISPVANAVQGFIFGDEKARRDFFYRDAYNVLGGQLTEHMFENWPRVILGAYNFGAEEESDIRIKDFRKSSKNYTKKITTFRDFQSGVKQTKRGIKDVFDWLSEQTEMD